MTALRSTVARLFSHLTTDDDALPAADFRFAPARADDLAAILDFASEHGLSVLPWGRGTRQGIGGRVQPDIVVSTSDIGTEVDWSAADLTARVGAGVRLDELEGTLATGGQSVVGPEHGDGTVGGMVAAGMSGWRRLRYGPIRERVLEVVMVTGDGRVVKAGAGVVKSVTGYDIPRLATGSLGSLGVIVSVCFKLVPIGEAAATVRVPDAASAAGAVYRPLAVLEDRRGVAVYLSGPGSQVEADIMALAGTAESGHTWPPRPEDPVIASVRVPPASTADVVSRIPRSREFVAAHGVGEVTVGFPTVDDPALADLREHAETQGGALVLVDAPDDAYARFDPWGTPPIDLGVQARVKAAFDPKRVMVPGRLPGGL